MGSYVPHTNAERQQMLETIGVSSMEDLFANVPRDMLLGSRLNLPHGLSEMEVSNVMAQLAQKNRIFPTVLRGAGAYRHYIPAVVKSIMSREELITAYTPYQAEISQGLLQATFEFQTMICMLTGMDASNASIYDGATAAAEAVTMCKERKRTKAYISATAHPDTIETMKTYCFGSDTDLTVVPSKNGKTDIQALKSLLSSDSACFYVQNPNFYGQLEDAWELGEITHAAGAKFIMGVNPIACAIMPTPMECGADIAVGEGQPLGLELAFGGPYLGFMACRQALARKLPGRIVGQTTDSEGKRGFVLTLTAREQHIRREKSTSNVCSNQALCAFTASVYMSAMGREGLQQAANLSLSKAHYLAQKLEEELGWKRLYDGEYFYEFVSHCPCQEKALKALADHGILGGLPVDGGILWCVTECVSKIELDKTVAILREVQGV